MTGDDEGRCPLVTGLEAAYDRTNDCGVCSHDGGHDCVGSGLVSTQPFVSEGRCRDPAGG